MEDEGYRRVIAFERGSRAEGHTMAPSEQQLRKRIHRLFSPDGCPVAVESQERPDFWVPPDGKCEPLHEQPLTPSGITEQEWLDEPHAALDGKSPNQVLRGCDRDREKLAHAICAVEEGAFS